MADLVTGQRVSIEGTDLAVRIDGPRLAAMQRELEATLVALDAGRRSATEFAPLNISGRETRPGIGYQADGSLKIDLSVIPPAVDRLLLVLHVASGVGSGITFRDFGALSVSLGAHRFQLDLTNRGESALILVELYRRTGGWRLSASGQGFVGGIAALNAALDVHLPIPARADRSHAGPANSDPPRRGTASSGSGFAADNQHILTNFHVIDDAVRVDVANDRFTAPAEIVFSDPANDIALLRTERTLPAAACFRDQIEIHLGEDVMVLGFPLQGLLGSGPQATAGNISALCGIGNNTGIVQFSAPIASGNSGGPILDQSGLVIGLVHASLNIDRIREGGSSAENVNFGVKGALVRAFLGVVGIEPSVASTGTPRTRAAIVREARSYIYRIRCEG